MLVALLALSLSLPPQQASTALLDVPYVAQTPELCGGAAVSMVLRYWGERQVFPEDFASLVVPAERGIPTRALSSAVLDRGWQATIIDADSQEARAKIYAALDRGQPLVALIEVSPRTYHYIVIAGATKDGIVAHDPARSPFRVLSWESFDRAWAAAGRWMMLVLPPADRSRLPPPSRGGSPGTSAPAAIPSTPCDALVERGVELALCEDKAAAEETLVGATLLCPGNSAAWRELAGLRFSQQRWGEAQSLAQRALRLAPDDGHARELLATSRYLSGDHLGALDAWSITGQPRIDLIEVHGAERIRHPVVLDAAGLQARQVLTSSAFTHALKRVQALPALAVARMRYEPLDGGLARVDVSVSERDPYPKGWTTFAVVGGRAAVGHELKADVANLFGAGERISASGRWQEERPRVALTLVAPSPLGLPGIASFETMWDRQSYSTGRETRRRNAVQLTDWASHWLRWKAGLALDHIESNRFVAIAGGADVRLARDRVAVVASASQWLPTGGASGFGTRAALLAWRSSDDASRPSWSALTELNEASETAPLAVWEGAGTGSARAGLLRAHPLLHDGVLTGAAFGRRLARGTLEYVHPVGRLLVGTVSVAAFVDAARAWHRLTPSSSPLLTDAGVGVRVRVPGRSEVIRIDIAHGLRGGGATFSVGILDAWPR